MVVNVTHLGRGIGLGWEYGILTGAVASSLAESPQVAASRAASLRAASWRSAPRVACWWAAPRVASLREDPQVDSWLAAPRVKFWWAAPQVEPQVERAVTGSISDDVVPPSFAFWRKERSVTCSTPDGGTLPPSLAVRREGKAIPGLNPNDGAVPSSVAMRRLERSVTGSFPTMAPCRCPLP